ncbi:LacI family transcriptional regulator [Xaviernesmea oryzae]|uniref:LacI family transcriptional regulator n=1 Tax=Xaviernesmea oryzae TaxID=464029 RepID=A0A1Q9B3C1_9HYPH|nr:LacI family DNA-binding transcriptional regulator [Xaviernesmea oryzae]OLP62548.1 LacI family transcriptional regulator [Xaviernesmea oryzae]SEM19876.1 transcriptional regulator, LacI family [Xaviernesmea oryzae]
MRSRSITQKEVAERAGVAQATVSLVLNGGREKVSAETAERIEAAIAELGYQPNRFAQALRTQRSYVIACVVPDLANPFYPSMVVAVQRVARAAGYEVITIDTEGLVANERQVVAAAEQGRFDGIVGVFFNLGVKELSPLSKAGIPVVRIEVSRKAGGPLPIDDLFIDNEAAARALTLHLLSLGHRSVAMIAAPGGPQQVRLKGYLGAIATISAPPLVLEVGHFTVEGGREAADKLLDSGKSFTAIVAANDLMAIGVMQSLLARGVSIPDEVSVAGFDDILASALVTPALTTVAQFQDQIGARAAERLLARLAERKADPGHAEEMAFELIIRASVAAPPNKKP